MSLAGPGVVVTMSGRILKSNQLFLDHLLSPNYPPTSILAQPSTADNDQ